MFAWLVRWALKSPALLCMQRRGKGSMRHAKGLCHVGPVGFGFIQPLQLVADLAQQVFPPRNVGVGFDTQRRGAIHHAEHAAAQLRLRCRMHGGAHCQGRQAVSEMATTCTGCIRQKRWLAESHSGWLRSIRKLGGLFLRFRRSRRGAAPLRVAGRLRQDFQLTQSSNSICRAGIIPVVRYSLAI